MIASKTKPPVLRMWKHLACDTPAGTEATLRSLRRSGEIWCGDSQWQGQAVIRLSVCGAETTEGDIERAVAAFVGARAEVLG